MSASPRHPSARALRVVLSLVVALLAAWSVGDVRAEERPTRPPLRLQAVEVPGESTAVAEAVAHRLGLRPGDPLDVERLVAARRDLVDSGWFESVVVSTRRGDEPGLVRLRVEGTLDRGARFETGLGHDLLEGWYLNVAGVRWSHLLGPGRSLRLGWQVGERRSYLWGEAEFPRAFGRDFDLLLRYRGGGTDRDLYEGDAAFRQRIDHADLALGLRWSPAARLRSTLWAGPSVFDPDAVRRVEGEDELSTSLGDLGLDQGRHRSFDLAWELSADHRDPLHPWVQGGGVALGLRRSKPEDGDAYHRADLRASWAFAVGRASALAVRGSVAWSDPETPYYRRPALGGAATVRGYREASLSGIRGARTAAAASVEWRTPVLGRDDRDARVYGVLFADAGKLVDTDGDASSTVFGAGWGLRIRVPWIQFLALDAALPLSPDRTEDPLWIHLGLGFGF